MKSMPQMNRESKFFEALATSIASGETIKASAALAKCSDSQAYRICATTDFRSRVSEIRSEITSQAVGRLTQAATTAVATIVELLGPEHEPSVRLNASKAILLQLGPLTELGELRARLDRIESSHVRPCTS